MDLTVKLFGIGAVEISYPGFNVFIDAFNDYNTPPALQNNDIVLFTHSDGDHFIAEKTLQACSNSHQIIGPPSIAYPLLANTGLDPGLLQIVYPPNLHSPVEFNIGELFIKVYQTKHFIGWEPDHISFLLKYKGKQIYITGDSHSFYYKDPEIYSLDALIYSLVIRKVVVGKMNSSDGAKLHAKELRGIQNRLRPECIVGNHLINCDWTVSATDLKSEVAKEGLKNITLPESENEKVLV